ncbi:MAG: ABC transporter ATP-binding protein [Gammaproteobacteria bacterium]|nr:MAG: ABC transporter ATP-binding protein [Gammaproteobacteria bacterium]
MSGPVLSIKDLAVSFRSRQGAVNAVRGVDLEVMPGETLAIVGESGCGKSVTMRTVMGLLPAHADVRSGDIDFRGEKVLQQNTAQRNRWRGSRVGMIFQDPLSAMNPTMRIGDQIAEPLRVHRGLSRQAAQAKAVELLEKVGVRDAATRARQYPNAFSGGMLQRAMIAMALACEPELLIADEPTTALDVTVQVQVLSLMKALQQTSGMAIVLITHDLGIVASMADRVAVMYAGQVVEYGPVDQVFRDSLHPYTRALRNALPGMHTGASHLPSIAGQPPDLRRDIAGCAFAPRCQYAMTACHQQAPMRQVIADDQQHGVCCWLHDEACEAGRVYRGERT